MATPAIRFDAVSKHYVIDRRRGATRSAVADGFVDILRRRFRKATRDDSLRETVWALKDVSFQVGQGEVYGLVGRNGAGKSTALKLLSRITEPSSGRIGLKGRVTSLLEVGAGFHPELSGRENIYLNGAILGISTEGVRRRFDQIVAFSGVERFLDTPVKRFSSGMYVRLAFAIAAQLEHEIMVIDEVLAVGDAGFRDQCMSHIERSVRERGLTVLIVSHELGQIRRLASRCVLLEAGKMLLEGPTEAVLNQYMEQLAASRPPRPAGRFVRALRILGADGRVVETVPTGAETSFELELDSPGDGMVSVSVETPWGLRVATLSSPVTKGHHTLRCALGGLPLAPGNYRFAVVMRDHASVELERHPDACLLMVLNDDADSTPIGEGLVALRGRWSSRPGGWT